MEPTEDVGVLLVHGIGDHKEGDTLTSFGEPLFDWLREWLLGKFSIADASVLSLHEARLRAIRTEAESPAYAVATIATPGPNPPTERWIFCEAWWGDSVQPPVALKLLKWLWSRGPLLIFWHFYLRMDATRGRATQLSRRDFVRVIVSFILAASTQLVVVVALILWLIPIGKWRAGVVAVVRAATLTLGDSYVLLEFDIQRAALVDRVRRSLEWLEPRCRKVVVVAHSQGCAIAHEALTHTDTTKVEALVTIGSGLEKLDFLRRVRQLRIGLVPAQLLVPVVLTGFGMVIFGLTVGQRWHVGVGGTTLFAGLIMTASLGNALSVYRAKLVTDLTRLRLSHSDGSDIVWTDISAAHDLVPMGDGSMLQDQAFVTQVTAANEHSYLQDHVGYFQNHNFFIPRIWQAVSAASTLPLFTDDDIERVSHFVHLHEWQASVLAWSRRIATLAGVVSLLAFRHELVTFGKSIVDRVQGSPVNDLMKPLRAVAAVVAWIAQFVLAPQTPVSDLATEAIVGGLILLGGFVVWWLAFKSLWRAVAVSRGRSLCRGADVLHNRSKTYRAYVSRAAMQMLGAVPALVVAILLIAPKILSLDAIGQALAAAIALVCVVGAFVFAVGGPLGWREAVEHEASTGESDAAVVGAVFYPLGFAFLIGVLFWAAAALWPYTGGRIDAIQPLAWAVHGLSWQLCGAVFLRSGLSPRQLIGVIGVPPLCAGFAMAGSFFGIPILSGLSHYVAAYTLGALIWIPVTLLSTMPHTLRRVVPAVRGIARSPSRFSS